MTPKEADEAARNRLPVMHNGIEYDRITIVGYRYDEAGNRAPFVQLLDKHKNSVTDTKPDGCTLKNQIQEGANT